MKFILGALLVCLFASNSWAGESAAETKKGITEGQAQKIIIEERRQRMEKFVHEVKALAAKYKCILVPEITIRGDKIEGRIVPMPLDGASGTEPSNPQMPPKDNLNPPQ